MEIDIAKDWNYFDVGENISKKKELWNERANSHIEKNRLRWEQEEKEQGKEN